MTAYNAEKQKKARLAALRRQLAAREGGGRMAQVLPFAVTAIDAALPAGGLPLGALHEVGGDGAESEDGAAAVAFLAGILARLSPSRPILWCLGRMDLYVLGLALYGVAPQRLILARATNDREILWAMEEGLNSPVLAAVIGEVGTLPALASRRLQLAAETSGVTAFVLHRQGMAAAASSAVTRWRIAALPGVPVADEPGVGRPLWRADLLRCRGGLPASWNVEACDATGLVSLSPALGDRSAPSQRHAIG